MSEAGAHIIDIKNWDLFKLTIREGFGFSQACDMTQNSKKQVTAELKRVPTAMAEVLNMAKNYVAAIVKNSNDAAMGNVQLGIKADPKLANELRDRLAKWTNINLWEDVCTKDKVTTAIIAQTWARLKRADEVATVCGLEYDEYVKYITENGTVIRRQLEEIGIKNAQLV